MARMPLALAFLVAAGLPASAQVMNLYDKTGGPSGPALIAVPPDESDGWKWAALGAGIVAAGAAGYLVKRRKP
jgi:hypothetical protein